MAPSNFGRNQPNSEPSSKNASIQSNGCIKPRISVDEADGSISVPVSFGVRAYRARPAEGGKAAHGRMDLKPKAKRWPHIHCGQSDAPG